MQSKAKLPYLQLAYLLLASVLRNNLAVFAISLCIRRNRHVGELCSELDDDSRRVREKRRENEIVVDSERLPVCVPVYGQLFRVRLVSGHRHRISMLATWSVVCRERYLSAIRSSALHAYVQVSW